MAADFEIRGTVAKVDPKLGLVFGFGAVSTKDGEPYYDLHGEHLSEDELLKSMLDFVENWQIVAEEHGDPGEELISTVPFVFPLLSDVAKALDIETPRTGALVGFKPNAECLQKFAAGVYTGFSIGGVARRRPAGGSDG